MNEFFCSVNLLYWKMYICTTYNIQLATVANTAQHIDIFNLYNKNKYNYNKFYSKVDKR